MNFSFLKKIILWTCLFFTYCKSGEEEKIRIPATILNEEKFTKILVDFALAESTSNINIKNVGSEKTDTVYAFDPLKENKVSKADYDSALAFYSKHPELYKKIYENVLVNLSKMQIKKDTVKVDSMSK